MLLRKFLMVGLPLLLALSQLAMGAADLGFGYRLRWNRNLYEREEHCHEEQCRVKSLLMQMRFPDGVPIEVKRSMLINKTPFFGQLHQSLSVSTLTKWESALSKLEQDTEQKMRQQKRRMQESRESEEALTWQERYEWQQELQKKALLMMECEKKFPGAIDGRCVDCYMKQDGCRGDCGKNSCQKSLRLPPSDCYAQPEQFFTAHGFVLPTLTLRTREMAISVDMQEVKELGEIADVKIF